MARAGVARDLVREGVAGTFALRLAGGFLAGLASVLPPPGLFGIFEPPGLKGPATFPLIMPLPRSTHSSRSTTRSLKNFGHSSANIRTSSSASPIVTLEALTTTRAASRSGITRRVANIASRVSAASGKRARRHRRRSCSGVSSAVRATLVSAS